MSTSPILSTEALGNPPWVTDDPFLFCVHHDDAYPKGNAQMGPEASLAGRRIGQDFAGIDGWRMYHGDVVPGFPKHPHRGFETITVVRRGLIDHSDSLGATARYGHGDVQWLTAGGGIEHAEMFPLVLRDQPNPTELFQIWLNLPAAKKRVPAAFKMLWAEDIPRIVKDGVEVTVIAGAYGEKKAPSPPPDSWASDPTSDFALWTIRMTPGSSWTLPAAKEGTARSLYFFHGRTLGIDGQDVPERTLVRLRPDAAVTLENGARDADILMLQGRPIGEPVARHGPFVMNTRAELQEAYSDYRAGKFGRWPWGSRDPVHAREDGRFARLIDGSIDRPKG